MTSSPTRIGTGARAVDRFRAGVEVVRAQRCQFREQAVDLDPGRDEFRESLVVRCAGHACYGDFLFPQLDCLAIRIALGGESVNSIDL